MNLIEPAKRCIHYLTTSVDHRRDGMPYFMTFWHDNGMEYRHNPWDIVENPGRYSAGVALARRMTGQQTVTESERQWKRQLQRVWDDRFGLYIIPRGFSFVQSDPAAARCCGAKHTREDDATCNWDNRSANMGMVLRGLLDGDDECIAMGRRIHQGWHRWAVHNAKRKWCYYTRSYLTSKNMPISDGPAVPGQEMGGIITALVKDYQWFDNNASLELATGLANCMMHFAQVGQPWPPNYNTHSYFNYLAGLVRLFRATGQRQYIEYAKEHFDFYRPRFASSFGWVTEFPDVDLMPNAPASRSTGTVPAAEGCSTVDLIDTAIQLAKSGYPEYWNVAERAGRNYLIGAQVTDPSAFPAEVAGQDNDDSSFTDIPQRLVGILAGWSDPNDIVNFHNRTGRRVFQSCCGAHAPFGLFQLWDNTITRQGDVVSINLCFDRETPQVRCTHTTKGSGQFTIDVKEGCHVRVRIPEFVDAQDIHVETDGQPCALRVNGRYVDLGRLASGTKAIVRHPLRRRRVREMVPIDQREYDVEWLGTDVMSIQPDGVNLPVFGPRTAAIRNANPDPGATIDALDI